jgi:hypothetical protein
MPEVDNAAIEKRAKELCEQDGFVWDVEWKLPLPKYSKIVLRPVLKEEERHKYLARAREQLFKECGGALDSSPSQAG